MINSLFKLIKKCRDDEINAYAAQSALFIILSGIPFLIVILSFFKLTPLSMSDLYSAIRAVCPPYFQALLISMIEEMYDQSAGLLSVTAVAAVCSAAKGIQYMTNGFNNVLGLEENRNWFVMRFWAIVYTLVFAVVLILLLVLMVFQRSLVDFLKLYFAGNGVLLFFTSWIRWLLLLFALVLFFCVLFAALPNRKLSVRKQFPGACFTTVGWLVFSYGLSVYVEYFNGFSIYGSLTTLVLLMFWMYICVLLLMIGMEINVVVQPLAET